MCKVNTAAAAWHGMGAVGGARLLDGVGHGSEPQGVLAHACQGVHNVIVSDIAQL